MPWTSNDDIPSRIRQREGTSGWSDEQWSQFRETANALLEDGTPEDEAIPLAVEEVNGAEADEGFVEWIPVHTTGPMRQNGRVVEVTREYFDQLVREFYRRQHDLEERGAEDYPPIINPVRGPHEDGGESYGHVIGLRRRGDTLEAQVRWKRVGAEKRRKDLFDGFSFRTEAGHEDAQVPGKTYSPHLKEISPTCFGKELYVDMAASCEDELEDAGLVLREPAGLDAEVSDELAERLVEAVISKIESRNEPLIGFEAADDYDARDGQGAAMQGPNAYLKKQVEKFSIPDGAPESVEGRTKTEMVEALAQSAGVDPEAVQAAMEGKLVLWPDGLTEAVAEQFEATVEALRMGKVGGDGGDKEGDTKPDPGSGVGDGAAAGEGDASPGAEEGEPQAMAASEEGDGQLVEALDRIDELESKVERYERTSKLNTSQTSSPGEQPLSAAEEHDQTRGDDPAPDYDGLEDGEAVDKALREELDVEPDEAGPQETAQAIRAVRDARGE